MKHYTLVPTRRSKDGPWHQSWRVTGIDEARDSARDFFRTEGIPVLLRETDGGVVGVFTDRKVRCKSRR